MVEIPVTKSESTTSSNIVNGNVIAQLQPQFFVINDPSLGNVIVTGSSNSVTSGIPIAPKPSTAGTATNRAIASAISPQIGRVPSVKKRDERRRATHNEVERRRRDKINHWIMKLGSIIPVDGLPGGESDRPNIAHHDGQSKGGILSKACEYVTTLHNKVNKLVNNILHLSEHFNIRFFFCYL